MWFVLALTSYWFIIAIAGLLSHITQILEISAYDENDCWNLIFRRNFCIQINSFTFLESAIYSASADESTTIDWRKLLHLIGLPITLITNAVVNGQVCLQPAHSGSEYASSVFWRSPSSKRILRCQADERYCIRRSPLLSVDLLEHIEFL